MQTYHQKIKDQLLIEEYLLNSNYSNCFALTWGLFCYKFIWCCEFDVEQAWKLWPNRLAWRLTTPSLWRSTSRYSPTLSPFHFSNICFAISCALRYCKCCRKTTREQSIDSESEIPKGVWTCTISWSSWTIEPLWSTMAQVVLVMTNNMKNQWLGRCTSHSWRRLMASIMEWTNGMCYFCGWFSWW